MNFLELQKKLITLTKRNITQSEIAAALRLNRSTVSIRTKRNSMLTGEELKKIEEKFAVSLSATPFNIVKIAYEKHAYIDLNYCAANNTKEYFYFDKNFLQTLGLCENNFEVAENALEIVKIGANALAPNLKCGDFCILDKSEKKFKDGCIFAFKYKGTNFIREINLLNDTAKAIPLNEKYDVFYIELDDVEIFGRIVCTLGMQSPSFGIN